MLQHLLKLVLGYAHAERVGRIDAENDATHIFIVVLPEISIPPLPRHVKDCEVEAAFLELFDIEAHGGHNLLGHRLSKIRAQGTIAVSADGVSSN